MSYATLDSQKTAVYFHDMLNVYLRSSPERERESAVAVANSMKLRKAAKAAGALVCYVGGYLRPDGMDMPRVFTDTDHRLKPWKDAERQHANLRPLAAAGTWNAQIIDELAPDEDDYVIRKNRWSGLFQTPLELSLRTRGVDTLVLCGGLVSTGLASTAYSAHDLDFNLVFARDCCTWHSQGELDFFMIDVFPRMGRVRTAEEVIAMLRSA